MNTLKLIRFIVMYVSTLFILSSCNQLKVITNVPYNQSNKIQEIALMPVVFGKIDQPILPLIDAGMFNKKTNNISAKIIATEMTLINDFRVKLAEKMTSVFNAKVIYGEELRQRVGFKTLDHQENSLDT